MSKSVKIENLLVTGGTTTETVNQTKETGLDPKKKQHKIVHVSLNGTLTQFPYKGFTSLPGIPYCYVTRHF